MSDIQININSQVYLGQFLRETSGHISDFRNILRTIEDESFVSRSQQKGPNVVVHFQAPGAPLEKNDATQRAIDNTYLAMMRSLVSFIDRIISMKRANGKPIKNVPGGTLINDELLPYLEKHLDEFYRTVAEDTSLANPKKILLLDGLPDWARSALLSMFAIRRSLEHHSGISKTDLTLKLRQMKIAVGDQEIGKLPMHVSEGAELTAQVVEVDKHFRRNIRITLSELDIENLFFTFQNVLGPAILQTLAPVEAQP